MIICLECKKEINTIHGLKIHLAKSHKIKYEDYLVKYFHGGIHPVCRCGCGEEVNCFRGNFKDYKQGHSVRCSDYLHNDEVRKRSQKTNIERYGGISPACSQSVIEKTKQTCLERYGVPNPAQSVEVMDKIKKTNIERYGAPNPNQSKAVIAKRHKTNLERYGNINPAKNKVVGNKISETTRLSMEEILLICANKKYELRLPEEGYTNAHQRLTFLCTIHNVEFESNIMNLQQDFHQCPKCKKRGKSKEESKVFNYVKSIYEGKVVSNTRQVITPREVDVFIPEKNLAIEYNGIYWHSEMNKNFKNNNLSYEKFKSCEKKGIKLLQFFSNEWRDKESICKSLIAEALDKSKYEYNISECQVREDIPVSDVVEFLENNHINGYSHYSKSVGIYHDGELVSVMTALLRGNIEISRYCNKKDHTIFGAFSSLVDVFSLWSRIAGFGNISIESDCRFDFGGLFADKGFKLVGRVFPDYKYTNSLEVYSKEAFAVNKEIEEELARENKVFKMYDAGSYLWELNT